LSSAFRQLGHHDLTPKGQRYGTGSVSDLSIDQKTS
jgi:hypothetical protein